MPVATQASLKGLTAEQLESVGCRLCLNNTYHLWVYLLGCCGQVALGEVGWGEVERLIVVDFRGLKPGQKVLDELGGAHKLQGWNRNILTGK